VVNILVASCDVFGVRRGETGDHPNGTSIVITDDSYEPLSPSAGGSPRMGLTMPAR
jgi:hypothetical protein